MKWLNCLRICSVVFGIVVVIVLGALNAQADFTFGEPTNLGAPVNTSAHEIVESISADGLEMYFSSDRPGGYSQWDNWVTTRTSVTERWGDPCNLGPQVNSPQGGEGAYISFDGLSLFFNSRRPGGSGGSDLWIATRKAKGEPWDTAENLGPIVNSPSYDGGPSLSTDGLQLYFSSNRSGGYGNQDIWVTTRETVDASWQEPVNLGDTVNSSAEEGFPRISADGLSLFFMDANPLRPGGFGGQDMWITTRASVNDPWSTPVNLGPVVNSPSSDCAPAISSDGYMLYFGSFRPGGLGRYDIWQAPIIPIVDLNSDGIVDSTDICIMVDLWGTDEPLCDIGPTPFGDGVVDVQDLIVLANHLFEEFPVAEVVE